jgi:endonuclease/exonuclease/phosphatase family metal-dependent hydrolase
MAAATSLRVVTFNIRHGAPKDSYAGLPDKLAESCAALDADILALQEVDVGVPRSRKANLAKVAADACGMDYYFAKARKHAYRGQYGNALLVRGNIADVEVVTLSGDHRHTIRLGRLVLKPFREPRNAVIATVTVGATRLAVGTGHFAADSTARRAQLTTAAARLVEREAPHLLLGDFNIPWKQAADWLQPYGLTLAAANLDPNLRTGIDHVATNGLSVASVQTRWLAISDHPAKIVELTAP